MECRALFPESRGVRPVVLMGEHRDEDHRVAAVSSETRTERRGQSEGPHGLYAPGSVRDASIPAARSRRAGRANGAVPLDGERRGRC